MTEEEIYDACTGLSVEQRKILGIYKLNELAEVLRKSGRKKMSLRTLQRIVKKDSKFPAIKPPFKTQKSQNFYRLLDVEAHLDRDFLALQNHFGGHNE